MAKIKVGVIGLGKMGEAMAQALLRADASGVNPFEVRASVRSAASLARAEKISGLSVGLNNLELAAACDIILLAVKPFQAEALLNEIKSVLRSDQILISVAATISLDQLKQFTQNKMPVVRAMPNLPTLVAQGMTIFSVSKDFSSTALTQVEAILSTFGGVLQIEESKIDAATAISGCGPAYVFMMIEALSDAGVQLGLSRKTATLLAAKTLQGSAQMLIETGRHPGALKDEVTTPGGITIEGVVALEAGHMRSTLMNAVFAAAKKAADLKVK